MSTRAWAPTTLGELLPLKYGKGLPQNERTPGTVPVYGSSGLVGYHTQALTAGPTIIVGRKGNVGEVSFSESPCWPIDTVYFHEAVQGIDLRFFVHLLRHTGLRRLDKSTAVPSLSRDDYDSVPVGVPPEGEQRRIVEAIESYVSRLDAAIATLEAAQKKLKAYRASILKAAVEGRLVPTEAALARAEKRNFEPADVLLKRILSERRRRWEEAELAKLKAAGKAPKDEKWKSKYEEPTTPDTNALPRTPEGWCWASFEQLTSFITSGSRGWAEYYAEEGPTFVRAQDIKTDALVLEGVAHVIPPRGAEGARTAVHQFDLVVTITGANVTKTALVERDIGEAYVSQHVALCRPVDPALAPYLHAFVVCPSAGRRYLEKAAYGAGKPGLNLDNLKQMVVALPPQIEGLRIVDSVDRLLGDARHDELVVGQSIRRIGRLRQSVVKWAFEGKLVDQDPNDEPAEKLLERIRAVRSNSETPKRTRRAGKAQ